MAKIGGIWQSEVARAIPFDKNNISFTTDNVQAALQQLRTNIVWDPEYNTTSLNGTLNLISTNTSLQILTGTATGYSVVMPNATTLFNGAQYQIVNAGTQNITVKDNTGVTLLILSQTSTAYLTLQDNSTAAGIWVFFQNLVNVASGVLSYNITTTTAFTTSSTTDVEITSFNVTPVAGTYAIWYSSSASCTQNNSNIAHTIYSDSTSIADSVRTTQSVAANFVFQQSTQTIFQVNGTNAINIRVKTSQGSITIGNRSILLIRLGT